MSRKITRYDMMGAISLYFRKIGQYSPCRQNSTKADLERIIQQYNMNIDSLLVELADEREQKESNE